MIIIMGKLPCKRKLRRYFQPRFYIAPLAMLMLLASPLCRADWKITPTAGISETYTDNVNLSPDGTTKSEFITELMPGISIEDNGPNLKMTAVYQLEYFDYSDKNVGDINQFESFLQANAKASLIKEFFYLDGSASINQQSISPFGPQVNNNPYSSTNHTEVKTYSLSPYLQHSFDTTATAELMYSHQSANSGNALLGNTVGDSVLLDLASGPAFRLLSWDLQYNHETIQNTISPTITSDTASGNMSYSISPEFSITGTTGYDEFGYQGLGGAASRDYFWLVGMSWTPTQRSNVQASGGRRYGGPDYTFSAKHHSRHSVWMINYTDAVTTSLSQFTAPSTVNTAALLTQLYSATISNPALLQQTVANYISETGIPTSLANSINFFSDSFFLQKQLQASAAFNTAKSTLIFSLFDTENTSLATQQANSILFGNNILFLNENIRQLGASAMLNWQITSRSNAYLNTNYNKIESLSTDLININRAVILGMTRQIRPNIQGTIEVRRVEGSSNEADGIYHENAVMASLTMQL